MSVLVNNASASFLVTSTGVNTGTYGAVTFITASTLTTCTGLTGASLAGVTFPAGLTIFGPFTVVTFATGSGILYSLPQ